MLVKKDLGNVQDGQEWITLPLTVNETGVFTVNVKRPNGSNARFSIALNSGDNVRLPNQDKKRALEFGNNVLDLFNPDGTRFYDSEGFELFEIYFRRVEFGDFSLEQTGENRYLVVDFGGGHKYKIQIVGHHLDSYPTFTLEARKVTE